MDKDFLLAYSFYSQEDLKLAHAELTKQLAINKAMIHNIYQSVTVTLFDQAEPQCEYTTCMLNALTELEESCAIIEIHQSQLIELYNRRE